MNIQGSLATAIRRARALTCLAVAGLAGCVVLGPDYHRPQVPLPPAWRADLPDAADVANTAWWEAFSDADLNALIATALDANKDLRLATLRIEQFDARLQISRAANVPEVKAALTGERERRSQERPNGLRPGASPNLNNFEISASVSWELDLWGRVQRSNEAALATLLSTEEARRAVMLSVVSSVAASYVQLLATDSQLALVRKTLKNRQDALALVTAKYEGGSSTRLAVAQARSVVEAVSATIPEIERQIATLENALSSLLGRNPGPIQRHAIDALRLPPVPQGVPSDVLARRPDVRAAEQTLVAANARIGVAKTEYFPVLSLTGALGLASDDLRYIGARTAGTGNYGAAMLGTIFSGGRIEGDIREAEAVQKQMVVSYELAVQTALREVEDALVYRAKSGEQGLALGRQVNALEEAEQLARMRYDGGQSSFLEVLNADFELYGAQGQQAQSQRDTFLALISVYKAMGGGWMVEQDALRVPATQAVGAQVRAATEVRAEK